MDIEKTIEDKTKDICDLIDSMVCNFKSYIAQGVDQADTQESGMVSDIIKDLSESYCNIAKAIYHLQITKAMEESEYGVDYDEHGKKYYHDHKDTPMRGMYPYEYYRDIDRDKEQRMYYTMPSTHDSRMGRSSSSRVKYFETKDTHKSGQPSDKQATLDTFEEYLDDIHDDIDEMLAGETPEFKTMARQKLMSMANAI